jgi:hypothetical protein
MKPDSLTKLDWHERRSSEEPPCAAHQWRTRDRMVVIDIEDMDITHLNQCIMFATHRKQHASRLFVLLEEKNTR